MKIAFLAPAVGIHTVRWVNGLTSRGHEVHLITMHPEGSDKISKKVFIHELTIRNSLGYYFNAFELKKKLKQINPKLLHVHYASGYGTLSRLSGFSPILLSVWGSDVYLFPKQNKLNQSIIKKNFRKSNYLASTSIDMSKEIKKYTNKEEIFITPFGVDTNLFYPMEKNNDSNIVIGMIKRFDKIYGAEYLIKAVKLLLDRLSNEGRHALINRLKVVMIGDGQEIDSLKNLSKNLSIDHFINFIVKVPHSEVPNYLKQIDIFCVPSLSESFGVAALEASACGKPVIATSVGGLPEVVKDGETGFIIPPANELALSNKLYELILDENLQKKFGVNGRNLVLEKYSWEKSLDIMEEVYKTIETRECLE